MFKIGFFFFVLLLFAGLASAQVPTSGNVFFGYSYENTSSSALGFGNSSRANLNGWEATVEGKFPAEEVVQVWMTPGLRMRSSRNPGGALGERSHLPHSGTTGAGRTPSNVAT